MPLARALRGQRQGGDRETSFFPSSFPVNLPLEQNENTRRYETEFVMEMFYLLCRKLFDSFLGNHKFCKMKSTHLEKKREIFLFVFSSAQT